MVKGDKDLNTSFIVFSCMVPQNNNSEDVEKKMQLMKENCIFCKIISGEFDAKKIFEDDKCIAILDIHPATKGHLLLLPKEHYMMMPLVPDDVLGHLGIISKYLTDLLSETFQCSEVTTMIANGAAAGQQSQHFLMHVIPRYEGDSVDLTLRGTASYSQEELEQLAQSLHEKLVS